MDCLPRRAGGGFNREHHSARTSANWPRKPRFVDKRNRVVALDYNEFRTETPRSVSRTTNNDMVMHVEENAVLIAGRAAEGGTIYVSGKPVCSRCAGVIIQSGITREWLLPNHRPIILPSGIAASVYLRCKCLWKPRWSSCLQNQFLPRRPASH